MSALSKAKIAEGLCEELKFSKTEARDIVELFYEELRQCLEQGNHVKLSGFGNFVLRDKSSRPGRNPKTGEDIPVDERRVVTFRPGLKLKSKVEAKR